MSMLDDASHLAMNNADKYRNLIAYLFMSVLTILTGAYGGYYHIFSDYIQDFDC
jgi:hypothetical protein